MESNDPSAGGVKGSEENSDDFSSVNLPTGRLHSSDIRDRRTFKFFLRAQGYLRGAFITRSQGRLRYLDWNNGRFHRKTLGEYSLKTIERQFPRFQRWCDEYRFQKVNVSGRWVVRVTMNDAVQPAVPGATVRDRLVAAIRRYVALAGRCHCDREFVRKFSDMSALPMSACESIWLRIEKIEGLRLRFRGEGRGRKIVATDPDRFAAVERERAEKYRLRGEEMRRRANLHDPGGGGANFHFSDPQTSRAVSIPYGNERFKDSGRAARSQTKSAGAAPPPVEPAVAGKPAGEPSGETTPEPREPSGLLPLQICARFVSRAKIDKFARWVVFDRLRPEHANRVRIAFLFPHAFNFARRALLHGYRADVIVSAYAFGVERSHQDALDADRLPGGGYASVRPPSAAVVYAWLKLRGDDPRDASALWAEIFATPRAGRLAPSGAPRPVPGAPMPPPRLSATDAAEQLAELRAVVKRSPPRDPDSAAVELTAGELAEFLVTRDLTLAKFTAQPLPRRQWLLAQARVWKERRRPS